MVLRPGGGITQRWVNTSESFRKKTRMRVIGNGLMTRRGSYMMGSIIRETCLAHGLLATKRPKERPKERSLSRGTN